MTAAKTVAACQAAGVVLSAEGDGLRFRPTPPPALLAALKENKVEVLALLASKKRPLTEDEKRQIRTTGMPMPKGVSFGQTATGQWRRLA